MYFDYLKERYGDTVTVVEQLEGFIIYQLQGDALFIMDLYIKPKYRQRNYATSWVDEIVDNLPNHITRIAATVDDTAINKETIIQVLTSYGLQYSHQVDNDLWFFKTIK